MTEHDPIDYSQHEEYLPEHVHEYSQEYDDDFICIHCGHMLSFQEALPKINATERLSTNMAMALCRGIHPNFKAAIKALTAYANILEGKDA